MRIGRDKLRHAGVCFVLEIALAATGVWNPLQRVVFVAGIIGGAKEIYDMTHDGHDADWKDIAADAIGAALGEVALALILH